MARFRHLYDPQCAFGGYSYEATTDGEVVHIKVRTPRSNSFKIVKRISRERWDAYADKYGLNDPYYWNDPAPIARLADSDDDDHQFDYW